MARRLALPIAITPAGLATLEQDSDADLAQSIALLLDTRPGERRSVPEYGLPDPTFTGLNIADLYDALATWEPRADNTLVERIAETGAWQEFTVTTATTATTTPGVVVDEED